MLPIRREVITFLRGLDDEDLAAVLSEAMMTRNSSSDSPDGDFSSTVYTIAKVLYAAGGPVEVYVVATARYPEHLPPSGERSQHAHEQGRCKSCGALVISTSKVGTCPVCGAEVECT